MNREKMLHYIVVQYHNPWLTPTNLPYLRVKVAVVANMEDVRVSRVQVTPRTALWGETDDRVVLQTPLPLCRIDGHIRASAQKWEQPGSVLSNFGAGVRNR